MINLYSHNGANNHGCEAIVRSMVKIIDNDLTLLTNNIEMDNKYKLNKIIKLIDITNKPTFFDKILNKILIFNKNLYIYKKANKKIINQKGEIFISIGGDNYCYNGYEKNLIAINNFLNKKNKKTILFGCSIEPDYIANKKNIEDLAKYSKIYARESLTYNALNKANLKNISILPDPAFLLDIEKIDLPKIFEKNVIGINISELYFNDYGLGKEQAYLDLINLIEHILNNTNYNIALIPHVVNDNEFNEYNINKKIYEKYKATNRIANIDENKKLNCMQIKYIISQCNLIIAARTHVSIAAYSAMVPTLVLGYSIKSKGIATDIFGDYNNYVLSVQDIKNKNKIKESFIWLDKNKEEIKKYLVNFIPSYINKLYKFNGEINE